METSLQVRLHHSLDQLIAKTEEIYLNMANRFPELFKELEVGFQEANEIVGYFVRDDQQASGGGLVGEIIGEAKTVVSNAGEFFTDMRDRDQQVFDSINRSIERLSELEKVIENIQEDSIEMELISLNAMTAALKAGKAGRAFSYITEELKKLSSRTISYTRELIHRGEEVLGFLVGFRQTVENIQSFQNRFYGEFHGKLSSSFEVYNQGVSTLADILSGVIEEAKSVKTPLFRIMEEVQLQDIIRQSIDHVIISIRQPDLDLGGDGSEADLDALTLMERVPELCVSVLGDVAEKIRSSHDLFREKFAELRRILERVEEERKAFLEFVTETTAGEVVGGALNSMFDESVGVLQELLAGIDDSVREKKKVGSGGQQVVEGLRLLEEAFRTFFEIVERFYSIEVASKIEVAKEEGLKDRQGTVMEMTELTAKIENDVKVALAAIKESLVRTDETVESYVREVLREQSVVAEMRRKIQESYERLVFSKNTLSETLRSFSVYTARFFELMGQSERDLERLAELLEVIEQTAAELERIRGDAGKRRQQALQEAGLEDWTIRNNSMREIIERFTIFTHKKVAGELTGFEVEEGGSPGELTLF